MKKKNQVYTKLVFCKMLGIKLKFRIVNKKFSILNKKKKEIYYNYFWSKENNKIFLNVKIFNPRMYVLSPKDYHFDYKKYEIEINLKDKEYKISTFSLVNNNINTRGNLKVISDCLYTSGYERVYNYTTYLNSILSQ